MVSPVRGGGFKGHGEGETTKDMPIDVCFDGLMLRPQMRVGPLSAFTLFRDNSRQPSCSPVTLGFEKGRTYATEEMSDEDYEDFRFILI